MLDLIENTLGILTRITNSKAILLLKLNDVEVSVLSFLGDNPENYTQFNSSLFLLYKHSGTDINNTQIENLPECKTVMSEIGAQSCFIKNVHSISEQNESVFLLIFMSGNNNLPDIENDAFKSVIKVLANQVKENFYPEEGIVPPFPERKREEKIVINNWEDNFNKLLTITNDLIFILDKDGCFLRVNTFGAMMLDYDEPEMIGKHFLDFVEPDKKIDVSMAFSKMLLSERVTKIKTTLVSKLNKKIPVEIAGRTITKDDKIVGMLGMAKDLTKLNKYDDELKKLKPKLIEAHRLISLERSRVWQHNSLIEELDRLKNEFVSNISHEFRTPLASIIGFSETIVSDPDLPEEMKEEFNNVILNEGKRLAKLINDILDLSKIQIGKLTLNKTNFDLVAMLNEVVESNSQFASEKKLTLDFEQPKEEILLYADKEKLEQATDALINNAIKFTNEDGRVKMIVNNLSKEIEIIISDTGIGIPEKDLPYIFQKFYRVSRPGTEIPGTGIGLVFVKQIIDLHKGLISVQSESGNGTTFVVRLLKNIGIKNS
ncbi:PAS domain-containing sensor histidine kinase [bacterium BMS3Abin03]|jgi:PAS domain S-box-containing protein|nr:PAS domain-containing sensor histidine kinase [bacterium BMS3Abin03]